MKKLTYLILNRFFGKKQSYRFFLILKNIGLQGLNYRNTNIEKNGELFLIQQITKHYKGNNLVLFDVGANIGNYAAALAKAFGNRAAIYAFEPFSVPYKQLATLQSAHPNIKALPFGLSNKAEQLTIHSSNEFSEIGGIYDRNFIFQDIPHDKQELCDFKTIDQVCVDMNIAHIHFLKIDVEGHELAVLQGAQGMLSRSAIDFIQFEFGAGNHFSRTYFIDFYKLLSPGYRLYRLLTNGLAEIKDYNSELEMQVLTNFIAISKKVSFHI